MTSETVRSDVSQVRTIRPLTEREAPEELRRVGSWLQAHPRALASTYPQVFHPLSHGEVTGLFVRGRMVSHAGIGRARKFANCKEIRNVATERKSAEIEVLGDGGLEPPTSSL